MISAATRPQTPFSETGPRVPNSMLTLRGSPRTPARGCRPRTPAVITSYYRFRCEQRRKFECSEGCGGKCSGWPQQQQGVLCFAAFIFSSSQSRFCLRGTIGEPFAFARTTTRELLLSVRGRIRRRCELTLNFKLAIESKPKHTSSLSLSGLLATAAKERAEGEICRAS